ncbi:hypothetical protein KO317_01420 [Candidatus Micrarchaeota archaeon]|nr:hypothetical protein [Candidatus Micrarchaeota archaeon]
MNTIGWIVSLLIIISVCLLFLYNWTSPLTEKDAETSVLEDLKAKYGNTAEFEIISIAENQPIEEGKGKYYTLKARVTVNPTSPCPERIHLYYNYPEQGFVTQPPDYITKNCEICVGQSICYLIFNEEAIIASHTIEGTENVKQYLDQYLNAKSNVKSPTNSQDNWIVEWNSETADFYYIVELTRNAELINVSTNFKE